MDSWWEEVEGPDLRQGDLLKDCIVPVMPADVDYSSGNHLDEYVFNGEEYDLIVLTQSCDLQNDEAPMVAACPVFALEIYEQRVPAFGRSGRWEAARQGRIEGLHLLASPVEPSNNRRALVVDFRQIYSLPIGYLQRRAELCGRRLRLRSPYLEHFSQAFARFFMRVGLPSDIPRFQS